MHRMKMFFKLPISAFLSNFVIKWGVIPLSAEELRLSPHVILTVMANTIQNSKDRLKELGDAPIGKLLFKYSLPAVVGTVVSAVYNIVDSIVIGHAIDDPNVVAGMAVTFR